MNPVVCILQPGKYTHLIKEAPDILFQQRFQIILPQQVIIVIYFLQLQEVTWANVIMAIQPVNFRDSMIKSLHMFCCFTVIIHSAVEHGDLTVSSYFYKSEPSAHRKIKALNTAVDIVHCPDNINVVRHVEHTIFISGGILGFDCTLFPAV